jgi:hypothetical protein
MQLGASLAYLRFTRPYRIGVLVPLVVDQTHGRGTGARRCTGLLEFHVW